MPGGVLTQVAGGWQYVNHRDSIENYGTNGRLNSMVSAGHVYAMQYDGGGKLIRVTNPFGRSLVLAYDGAGRVADVTLPDGRHVLYGFGASNNLTSVQFPDGATRQYLYENASFPNAMTAVVDETGRRRVSFRYDALGRPDQAHYGSGVNTVTVNYGVSQVSTTDARGTQRVRQYATVGNRQVLTALSTLATADSPATTWTLGYDANGNPSSVQTRTGEVQQFSHDARARPLLQTRAAGTALAQTVQKTWHPTFRKPTSVVFGGVTKDYTIDSAGRITQVRETAGAQTKVMQTIVYNAQNLVQSVTDARGLSTTFAYDALGNRTSATNVALGQTVYFSDHDANGRAARIQRPDGVIIDRVFDSRGRVQSRTVAGLTTSYLYDGAGRVSRVTAPDGAWQSFTYDAAGVLAGTNNHRGESTSIVRDVAGAPVTRNVYSSGGGLVQTGITEFDSRGRVAAVVDSRNQRTRLVYAADGRLSGSVDPLGLTRTQQLDTVNRVVGITVPNTTAMRQAGGPATVSTAHSYDAAKGNHQATVDTNAVATGYAYDPFNRRNGESGNDAGGIGVVRNAAGDVTSVTDARGITLTRTLDTLGRVTALSAGSGALVQYAYVTGRSDGRLSSMTSPGGTIGWTYDSAGRVLTQVQTVQSVQRTVTYSRDSIGRPTNITYPSGMQLGIAYSGDVVASLTVNGSTLLNNIAYRPFSQVASGWRWGNGSNYSRSFDADGRVTAVSLGTTQRTYTYNPAGQITAQTDTGPSGTKVSTYAYDEAGQLTNYTPPTGTGQTFTYDTNGNRRSEVIGGVSRSYAYVAGSNRLSSISAGLRSYQYNNDGNTSVHGGYSMVYDLQGRLAAVNTSTRKVNSVYDGLGRRTYKTVSQYSDGTIPTSSPQPSVAAGSMVAKVAAVTAGSWVTTARVQFVYDPQGRLLGEYNSIGGSTQETIWFNGQPVATLIGGVLHYVNSDNLGTPRSIVRASDNVELWRWDSDPFGMTSPTSPNLTAGFIKYNLRFPGQYYDSETGLHYNGMRDYDPRSGRYIQTDPIGLGGGLSRYAYAEANPMSNTDPLGLWSIGFEAYGGIGGGVSCTCSDGKLEITSRLGTGAGGGLGFDPNQAVSPHAAGDAGSIARSFATVGAELKGATIALGASATFRSGNAITTKVGGDYVETSLPQIGSGNWQPKVSLLGAIGVEFGGYMSFRPCK
jgi:RHS repeat-associated protein